MKLLGFDISRTGAVEQRSIENPTVPVSAENFLAFFGISSANLPAVTIDNALTVPAFANGVRFLSRTLAVLPLHAYKRTRNGPERIDGGIDMVVGDAPNDTMGSAKFWQYFWHQVFTGGRGMAWIERNAREVVALWAFNPANTTIFRKNMRIFYLSNGVEYPAEDVIDVPFMLKPDQVSSYGPVQLAGRAIQLAIAMNDYGSKFFAGGGIPPLALEGPVPQGAEAMKRAMADIFRAIESAKSADKPVFPIPPGHKFTQVGFDPEKGQMTEARKFQIVEIARALDLPPFFVQDLENAHHSNAEQQDLHLVKHLIGQWAKLLEDELNLKLFGRFSTKRYVEFNLDGLLRGDFLSRMDGLSKAIGTGLLSPNEGRGLLNRPDHGNPAANELFIQGATVPLDKAGAVQTNGVANGP